MRLCTDLIPRKSAWFITALLFLCAWSGLVRPGLVHAECAMDAPIGVAPLSGNQSGYQYKVWANVWHPPSSSTTECVNFFDQSFAKFLVDHSNISITTQGPPAAYPSIYYGCHAGFPCTDGSILPQPVANLSTATSNWNFTVPSGGINNAAYDIWLGSQTAPNGAELMIWLYRPRCPGSCIFPLTNRSANGQPAPVVSSAPIGSQNFSIWTKPASAGHPATVTYLLVNCEEYPVQLASVDILAFIRDAQQRNFISSGLYIHSVEAGFEIWSGGNNLETSFFSVNIQKR